MQASPSGSQIAAKVFMCLAWSFVILTSLMLMAFLSNSSDNTNSFTTKLDPFFWGILIIPSSIALAIRFFAVNRIKNPWAQLLVYGFGLFISLQVIAHGIFLIPQFQTVFYLLGGTLIICYLPVWVRAKVTM
ncbi:hypothetical protein SAMN02745181_3839 [Rubritalea squalenifaciens DSM 18772]|uniref:Uncharacterized protein n=1 Tax=Rubritalea squalenifaciens DSM 18772 TaxID=1123071 RepID=A0A1M6SIT3_9BACT|nr:hypothetical protein [Rubritalea squalenifaciens]SHK44684.1 hypothetical protein SAMN02745181_3839 [Rubritalea squalenifaciens DSM 18772]